MSAALVAATAACGALLAAGAAALAYAGATHPAAARTARALAVRAAGLRRREAALHAGAALAAGAATGAATGWPVAAVLAAAGLWWLPRLLGPDTATTAAVARIEAVAAWAEQLRDMIAGASGLQHAIATTAPIAPEPIRGAVQSLHRALAAGTGAEQAFTAFAHRVAVPTGDLVAIALSSAASGHAADVGASLSRMAEAARERATTLGRVAASRARLRSSVRIIVATSAVMAAGLVLTNREFLTPYDTLAGQFVLAVVGAMWAAALGWLAHMARPDLGRRLLDAGHPVGEAAR
ncbi:type II secretion system protein F (GspF) [Murinocardiopsis flavida]|uniref:Type II secretion system protein F (GspF) n=1 Tax=Murinocardiopsis flavida TaxID=645275 RepID=A0A2P8DG25_9ACTN|nr:type II secretion protein F [Murinocardiopsis flavida]PSK96167.1 type II secretion system protein F (GspF) [Murinocardiopsis flavida]